MGRGYRTELHDDSARLIKEEILLGSVFVFLFIPAFSLAGLLLMIANSAHLVLILLAMLPGGMVMVPLWLWSAVLIKVTEVLQADAEGIRYTRRSPLVPAAVTRFVPTLCDRRVSYGEVKECSVTKKTTTHRHRSGKQHINSRRRTVTSHWFRFCLSKRFAKPDIAIYLGSGPVPEVKAPAEFAAAFQRLKARHASP